MTNIHVIIIYIDDKHNEYWLCAKHYPETITNFESKGIRDITATEHDKLNGVCAICANPKLRINRMEEAMNNLANGSFRGYFADLWRYKGTIDHLDFRAEYTTNLTDREKGTNDE